MSTLAESLDLVLPAVSADLASPGHVARIRAVGAALPASLASGVVLECHLGGPAARTDLEVRVRASEVGRQVLADLSASPAAGSPFDQPSWIGIGSLAAAWADPASELHRRIDNVWLEFDIDPDADRLPAPSVFFAPYNGIQAGNEHDWVGDGALRLITGGPIAPATEQTLDTALDALPAGANVFQLGVMLARRSAAVRCCIAKLPADATPGYLSAVGWPGRIGDLEALIARLSPYVDEVALDLDVADGIAGRVGLECYLSDFRQPGQDPRWAAFLTELVRLGLCRPERRDAVLGFPGSVARGDRTAVWPEHLGAAAALLGGRARSAFARVLHHVKIVFEPGRPLEAKAYLAALHHWRRS